MKVAVCTHVTNRHVTTLYLDGILALKQHVMVSCIYVDIQRMHPNKALGTIIHNSALETFGIRTEIVTVTLMASMVEFDAQ